MFYQYADAAGAQMAPGLIRRTLVSGERLMICRFDLDQGVEIPGHSHPHDQAGYVVSRDGFELLLMARVWNWVLGIATAPPRASCTPRRHWRRLW